MTDFISIEKVYGILENAITPDARTERLPLGEACGRVLAEAVTAPADVPPFNNSAMDGFAFRREELSAGGTIELKVIGTAYAGAPFEGPVPEGCTVRIMTGAPVPDKTDTVIPFERTASEGDIVRFPAEKVKPLENVRIRGEEIKAGETVIHPGQVLTPEWIGLAASLGAGDLLCRRISVAVFSTGDELVAPGARTALPPGKIYNANSPLITALCREWGAEVEDLGILPDDPEVIRSALSAAAECSDFIVASGGVGEGEHDYTCRVLNDLGCGISHYHISMRPGKPFSFGRFAGERACWFMALPGNPVAAAVSAKLFLRRAIRLATGAAGPLDLEEVPATAATRVKGRTGRTDLVRGRAELEEGELRFRPTKSQSSAMLTTLAGMNVMAVLDTETAGAEEGARLLCLRLD
ncbi:gephyrin-like molybdotransferase Glp [Sutterella sp.]|uniref:molybdopterin molybdotransferase MoeA n=1 Tax=Sutterella sp. TaxID=1981025 RepID=UPI0026DECB35|nr:gephyrin-like molybdotransferase Glp [Sutterella sp.]MDO5531508.1 molybdopterin molybdotransferase MoeA [Sutterella sp.]